LLAAPALAAGTLELNPSQGAAGDEFLISGDGFESSEQVKLKWDGSPIGPPVRADSDGAFTSTRSVPIDAPPGKHTVTAAGLQSGLGAEALFEVIDPAATTTTTTVSVATTTTSLATTTTAADEKTTTSLKTTTAADEKTTTSLNTATDNDGSLVVGELRTAPAETTPGSQVEIEGVATDDTTTVTGLESLGDFNLGDVLTTPIGLASAVGMPLVGAIAVWWMWRKPTDDENGSLD
jgi:hypothetical protein